MPDPLGDGGNLAQLGWAGLNGGIELVLEQRGLVRGDGIERVNVLLGLGH